MPDIPHDLDRSDNTTINTVNRGQNEFGIQTQFILRICLEKKLHTIN